MPSCQSKRLPLESYINDRYITIVSWGWSRRASLTCWIVIDSRYLNSYQSGYCSAINLKLSRLIFSVLRCPATMIKR